MPGQLKVISVLLICVLTVQPCLAWSEGGRHLIAAMALDLLPPQQRQEVQRILTQHPRFAEEFQRPANGPMHTRLGGQFVIFSTGC